MEEYDAVVMNPPFTKSQDILHVRHAYKFLKSGGVLVSIMSPGFTFRGDKKASDFRDWVERLGGSWEELPDRSFVDSGTSVSTVLLTIRG